jgi:hypothetical protein
MLFIGMPPIILSLVMGSAINSTHAIPCFLGVFCFCLGFHIKLFGLKKFLKDNL